MQLGFTSFDLSLFPMKLIAFILSIFIFTLSVTPCSDGKTCDDINNAEMPHHDHSEDKKDDCSPFCVCTCCGSSFLESEIETKPILSKAPFFKFDFHYSFSYFFSYNDKIWHPPTLS